MTDTQREELEKLAKGNRVDLKQIEELQEQLRQLERAGVTQRSDYAIQRPLGRTGWPQHKQTLADTGLQTK